MKTILVLVVLIVVSVWAINRTRCFFCEQWLPAEHYEIYNCFNEVIGWSCPACNDRYKE